MNQPRTLAAWEVRAVLAACDRDKRWLGTRDKALIALGALTGARAAALVSLNAGQVSGADGRVRRDFVVTREFIKRKQKAEEFAVPEEMAVLLEAALEEGRRHWRGHGPRAVFVSRSGMRLRREDVTRRIKARCAEAGVDAWHASAHSLRHLAGETSNTEECRAEGVATGALPDGIENIEVSRLFLGHKHDSTTRNYLKSVVKRRVRRHVAGMLARMILGRETDGMQGHKGLQKTQ